MRIRTAVFVLVPLLLLGCTRRAPIEEPPPATQGAAPLPALPSATRPPTATPIITPSPTATETSTPGPTEAPPAPDLDPDDPRYGLNLAAPNYLDAFNSNLTWVGPNFEGASNTWVDGRLQAIDYLADTFLWWSTTIPDIDAGNVYVEVSTETSDCAGKDAYGLALRVEPDQRNSGYLLEFSCDGAFRMRKLIAGSLVVLQDWTPSGSIRSGSEAANVMGFLAVGSKLSAFANGDLLGTVEDASFFSGNYGLYANAASTPGLTVFFDDFKLWYVNP
ncbi:MAG: hypothetical protein P8X64_04975 [Anaerolineales bacterium]|jgi:hypothetical protein